MSTMQINRKVDGRTYSVEVPTVERTPGEVGVNAVVLGRAELAIAAALALESPVGAEGFRFMRGALGLRAVDLAAMLDVNPQTVSRWERGETAVDRAAWLALGTLVLERLEQPPQLQVRMQRLVQGFKPPKQVRLELAAVPAA